jgi:hypothetical protein
VKRAKLGFDGGCRGLCSDGGAGLIDVVARNGLKRVAYITTASGARTSFLVPETDRLYLAMRERLISGQAAIQVYRPAQ